MKHMRKFLLFLALVMLVTVSSLSVSAAVIPSDETHRDEVSFFSIFPSLCPHEEISDWQIDSIPAGGVGVMHRVCTVCGTPMESRDLPTLAFNSASLSLTDNLRVNYKVNKSTLDYDFYSNPYVVFEMNNRESIVTSYTEFEDYYVFSFDNIAPHLMMDEIRATLHVTALGEDLAGDVQTYSVATYCYRTLATYATGDYGELRTLIVDLLNYGAASQTYVGYKTASLANAALTAEQASWGTATTRELTTHKDISYVSRDNATVYFTGAGLSLRDSIAIRFKIDVTDVSGLSAKVIGTHGVKVIPASEFVATTGGHHIYFDDLTAAQIGETVYITIYDGNTPVSNTISYSVESYAYSKLNDADATLSELVCAMVRYGDAAKAYVDRDAVTPEVPEGGWTENDKEGWTNPY